MERQRGGSDDNADFSTRGQKRTGLDHPDLRCVVVYSPWALGFAGEVMAAWTAWVGGLVIAIMGFVPLVQFAEWEEWIALIAGVLMVIAPWVLGFAALTYAVWTCVVLGIVVAVASVSEIWMVHRPALSDR